MEAAGKISCLSLVGDINNGAARMVSDWLATAECDGSTELFITLSSPGGKLEAAFDIYDRLRASSMPVTTYGLGNVESAAVLVYLAGDTRLVGTAGLFMVHALSHDLNAPLTKSSLPAFIECVDHNIQRYGDIFKNRTQGGQALFDIDECLCGGERYISAAEAYRLGLATAPPAEHKVPKGASWRHIS